MSPRISPLKFHGLCEGEEFIGFDKEDQLAVAASRQERLEGIEERDSESDISISSAATEDLSNVTDNEEEEELWNENEDHLNVAPFTACAGPMSGVAEDGTAVDFFYLTFPEELIEHIVSETNRYVCVNASPQSRTQSGKTQVWKK